MKIILRFGTPDRLVSLLGADEIDMAIIPRFHGEPVVPLVSAKLPFEYEVLLVCSQSVYQQHLKTRRLYDTVIALDHVSLWRGVDRIRTWYHHHFRKKPSDSE